MKKKAKRRAVTLDAAAKKVTLEDVVKVAHALGHDVNVTLVPNAPQRKLLDWPPSQWPGKPGTRHIMAAMDYTPKDVARAFKDNPTAMWVITPYEIISREQFFNPPKPPEISPAQTQTQQSTPKPT